MTASYTMLASSARRRTRVGDDTSSSSFDWGSLFQVPGEIAKKGLEYKKQQDVEQAAQKKGADDLAAALQADTVATAANARAIVSAQTNAPSAAADQLAAVQATAAQDAAAVGLSDSSQKKRAAQAKKALDAATAAWQKNPTSIAAKAMVTAAQATYAKTQNAQLAAQGAKGGDFKGGGGSWLTRHVLGPIPGWGVLLLGGGVATGLGALAMHFLRKR